MNEYEIVSWKRLEPLVSVIEQVNATADGLTRRCKELLSQSDTVIRQAQALLADLEGSPRPSP